MAFDLETCNTPRLRKRADYGVRVARPGYDANECAQNQLVFNSNWPIIQIAEVIDLNKDVETRYVWLNQEYSDTGVTREWSETEPAGITYSGGYERVGFSVGKNYIWYQTYSQTGTDSNNKIWQKITYKRIYHGLGYPPMFYRSEDISNISDYLIITSVDLSVDIDYPYTEGATMFLGSLSDYGIAGSSKFGKRVPGLRSDMFSKLIQAVKTEKTSNAPVRYGPNPEDISPEAGILYWSPLKKLEDYEGCLEPYEAVGYYGFNNPFGEADVITQDGDELAGFGTDGPYYRDDQAIIRAVPYSGTPSGSVFGDGVAFTNMGQSTYGSKHASMVIIRSPMVSPEYEEIVV